MKSFTAKIAILFLLLGLASSAVAEVIMPRPSPKASVSQVIGVTEVKITYSRPGVKNRTIWGGLVPYDKVWRTGANEATTISFADDVKIEGQPLPAGTYGLFTIPGQAEWTVIFNKNADQWGSNDYKQEQDALRIKVKPDTAPPQEWMSFSFQNLSLESGDIVFRWEKLQVKFTIQVDTANKVLASCRSGMAGLKADDWRTVYRCADFAFDNKGDEKEMTQWLEKSLSIKETFFNLALKAEVLAKGGKKAEAIAAGNKALTLTQDVPEEDVVGFKKKVEEWSKAQ